MAETYLRFVLCPSESFKRRNFSGTRQNQRSMNVHMELCVCKLMRNSR